MSWWNDVPSCPLFLCLTINQKVAMRCWWVEGWKSTFSLRSLLLSFNILDSRRFCLQCWCWLYGLFPVIFTDFHSLSLTDCLSSCSSCVSSTREQARISTVERYSFSIPYRRITATISFSLPSSSHAELLDHHAITIPA